jgi:hypothetical protein
MSCTDAAEQRSSHAYWKRASNQEEGRRKKEEGRRKKEEEGEREGSKSELDIP